MQLLDIVLLIVVVCLVARHYYKKGKLSFPFLAKSRKTECANNKGGAPPCTIPPPFPKRVQTTPNMSQYSACSANCMGIMQDSLPLVTSSQSIDFVKLIPWVFEKLNPLPFGDGKLEIDEAIGQELPEIGMALDAEIVALQHDGYVVVALDTIVIPVNYGDGMRVIFVLSCAATSRKKTQ